MLHTQSMSSFNHLQRINAEIPSTRTGEKNMEKARLAAELLCVGVQPQLNQKADMAALDGKVNKVDNESFTAVVKSSRS